MLVIQHRANLPYAKAYTDVAEIDVQIDNRGNVVVGHNPDGVFFEAEVFLKHSRFKRFFIDIKQNLPVGHLMKIMRTFDNRSIGLFDVPMPSAFFLDRAGVNFYSRVSDVEPVINSLTNRYWVDPLCVWSAPMYEAIASQIVNKQNAIVACPSLHGQDIEKCKEVWSWLKEDGRLQGIVTKHPREFNSL